MPIHIDSAAAAATLFNLICIFCLRWKSGWLSRLAQNFKLLVKLGGNCSLIPVKTWKFGAPTPAR
jgi:hypothetical protein